MDTLTYLSTKYDVRLKESNGTPVRSPIAIPNAGRDQMARLFYLLEFRRGVEVGVERGAFSEVLLRENPLLRLSCVDAWQAYKGYRDHVSQSKLDRFYVETGERLAPFGGRATLIRQFSVEAAEGFADGSLDFVYLDAAHDLRSVITDIAVWSKKVRPGGILAGHDYAKHRWPNQMHVVQAVQAWTDAYEIQPWFLWGRHEEIPGEIRDSARSWMWVHEPRPIPARMGRPVQQ